MSIVTVYREVIMKKGFKLITILLAAVLVFFLCLHLLIVSQGKDTAKENADYLIILGTRLSGDQPSSLLFERIKTAAAYLKENQNTIAIASGGQGQDEIVSEASVIKESLMKLGIEEKRIITETNSTRTLENFQYSMDYIDKDSTVVVVTNRFHLYRAESIAEDLGLNVTGLPAATPSEFRIKYYSREYLAIVKYYLEKIQILT